jgi:hypothetical protein
MVSIASVDLVYSFEQSISSLDPHLCESRKGGGENQWGLDKTKTCRQLRDFGCI